MVNNERHRRRCDALYYVCCQSLPLQVTIIQSNILYGNKCSLRLLSYIVNNNILEMYSDLFPRDNMTTMSAKERIIS